MDGSDWIIVLIGAVFVPGFLLGLFFLKGVRFTLGRPLEFEVRTPGELQTLLSFDETRLKQIVRDIAASTPGVVATDGPGLRFSRQGLDGRMDFISDKTEFHVDTQNFIRQVVEVVPLGFPITLFTGLGKDRLRARGSRKEYDRIFRGPREEQVLLELGVPYELRMSSDGVTLRIQSLPSSAAVLAYWLSCLFRMVDLIPEVEVLSKVQVTEVSNALEPGSTCQVCGSSLATGGVVYCASCRTAHHEGCWQYAGKCSTFGCGSLRFAR